MLDSSATSSFWERAIDFVFSNDSRKWLIAIVILGALLRFIVASNVPPVADEMVHGVHAIGLSKLAPLSTMTQIPVWLYLTDYTYRIFGIHLITARFLSFAFGTLSIILVYLLGSLLFGRKTGLVASFLLAISAYHITWTASYQDQTMMFFILLASIIFIKEYKKSGTISVWGAIPLGIAFLVKIITGVFVLVFGAFMLGILVKDYRIDMKKFKINLKRVFLFGGIIVLSLLPILSYDYFLYKEKGIVDQPFAQFLKINPEFYTGPGLAHGEGFVLNKLSKNVYSVVTVYFLKEDPLIFIMGLIGLVFFFKEVKRRTFGERFLVALGIFSFFFIASAIVLQTHYTTFMPLLALSSASVIIPLSDKLRSRARPLYSLMIILGVILLVNIYSIREPLTSKSAVDKMRSFAIDSIDQNTLVLVDARIYVGTTVWMFNDKVYASASHLSALLQASNQSGRVYPVRTFFVECLNDDCGWGTVKDQPDFNQSMEAIVSAFQTTKKIKEIEGGGSVTGVRESEIAGEPYFRVYEGILPLNPDVVQSVYQTHSHFFYHIPRDEQPQQAFDYYKVRGGFDALLNLFSYIILYVALGLASLSVLAPFVLVYRERFQD
ncbi:MAG: glycosyltransferase family 39 protein [Nanoarchaeota archaeon]